jgi:predicted methyltransferase
MRKLPLTLTLLILACIQFPTVQALHHENKTLAAALAGEHRSEANKARDKYRRPAETLAFFGITNDMTVIENWPGSGWYTEILAPYLKDNGQLIAATYDRNPESQKKWMHRINKNFDDKFVAHPETFGNIKVVGLLPADKPELAAAGTVDAVLDFRNAHNWIKADADNIIMAWHKALKPGGIVGLVDHRMDDDKEYNPSNGYVHEKQIIDAMAKHGFRLEARSDLNRNPKDTKDHPRGVWTLPPVLTLKDQDRDKYLAIGESDRMVLKFVKS